MGALFQIKALLNQRTKADTREDDFRIIDSWTEYEDSGKSANERKLKYLCYELETMNPETGEIIHFYKALKLARIIRIPESARQSLTLMDMQENVLSAVYELGAHLVTIIANILTPVAIGLMYLYGIQASASDIDKAKEIADHDFKAFINAMQGQFRVLELRVTNAEESEWLKDKMYNMEYMTVIRGIPKASKSGEDIGNKGIGGKNNNPQSEGTIETIVAGLADYEYVIEIISSPVKMETLAGWQENTEKDMTFWHARRTGQYSYSMNMSIPVMYMASAASARGWSKGYNSGNTMGHTRGESFSLSSGQSVGESLSKSFGRNVGQTSGTSLSNSYTRGVSATRNISSGESFGENTGVSQNVTNGKSFSRTVNSNSGLSASISAGSSFGKSQGSSTGVNRGQSTGLSYNTGLSRNVGISQNQSVNIGNNASYSHSTTSNRGISLGRSDMVSASKTTKTGYSRGTSNGDGYSEGGSSGWSGSIGHGERLPFHDEGEGSWKLSGRYTIASKDSKSDKNSYNEGFSFGESMGTGASRGYSSGMSAGVSAGESYSLGESRGYNSGYGMSEGVGANESYGTNVGNSISRGWGANTGISASQNLGKSAGMSISAGNGYSIGTTESVGLGQNYGVSHSNSVTQSQGAGESYSEGISYGQTYGRSLSDSATAGYGQSVGYTEGTMSGKNYSIGNTRNAGANSGLTGNQSVGTSANMGIGISIGYNKSYQWLDQTVEDLLEILKYQDERIKKGRRGQGAFYTYVYFACPSDVILSAAKAVAKAAWQNDYAMIQPLQALDLTEQEQKKLLYRFSAFSADVEKEDVFGVRQYRYCTVLLPEEYVAYTHIPRISEGGVYATIQDVPKFSTPSNMKGEIYMGTILNPERYTFESQYMTEHDYRLDEEGLMHGFFTGASRSGKTVAAMRFIAELSQIKRKRTGKRLRIVVMDPKQDWRTLARYVEPERFNFYSMGNPHFHPVKINVWKVPKGVTPQVWIDGIIDIYCRAYGLLELGKQMIATIVYALYNENGVFDEANQDRVQELSGKVCFADIFSRMEMEKANLENPNNSKGKAGDNTRDAYARLVERLSCFGRKYSIEYKLYGTNEGIGIDELIGKDDVTVLESKGLEKTFNNFIFGAVTSGFYKYAIAHDGGFLAEDQFETVLVIEEANQVLIGSDTSGGGDISLPGESEFEQILDQSAGFGLFVIAITQKISDMPSSVIANSGLIFAGRLVRDKDVSVVMRSIGKEERMDNRDIMKWFPRSPIGWFVCKSARTYDFKDAEPVLVSIAQLNVNTPSNVELNTIIAQKRIQFIGAEGINYDGKKIKIISYSSDFDVTVDYDGRFVKTNIHAFRTGHIYA